MRIEQRDCEYCGADILIERTCCEPDIVIYNCNCKEIMDAEKTRRLCKKSDEERDE